MKIEDRKTVVGIIRLILWVVCYIKADFTERPKQLADKAVEDFDKAEKKLIP